MLLLFLQKCPRFGLADTNVAPSISLIFQHLSLPQKTFEKRLVRHSMHASLSYKLVLMRSGTGIRLYLLFTFSQPDPLGQSTYSKLSQVKLFNLLFNFSVLLAIHATDCSSLFKVHALLFMVPSCCNK